MIKCAFGELDYSKMKVTDLKHIKRISLQPIQLFVEIQITFRLARFILNIFVHKALYLFILNKMTKSGE